LTIKRNDLTEQRVRESYLGSLTTMKV
jgi:hypothetical protein